jgi:hypothetical protein
MTADIKCEDGLCVAIVPDEQISGKEMTFQADRQLASIKDALVTEMDGSDADSGIMLLAPSTGARRFGPKPEAWLADGVSIEISDHPDLDHERRTIFEQYREMLSEPDAGSLHEEQAAFVS